MAVKIPKLKSRYLSLKMFSATGAKKDGAIANGLFYTNKAKRLMITLHHTIDKIFYAKNKRQNRVTNHRIFR